MANTTAIKAKPILIALAACTGILLVTYFGFYSPKPSQDVKISELIAASIDLVQRGGDVVRAVRKDESIGAKVKGMTSVNSKDYVTEGDKRSHYAIVSGLQKRWPNMGYVSEEHIPVEVKHSVHMPRSFDEEVFKLAEEDPEIPLDDILVWIDPLDATQEYTEGGEHPELLKYVTVMICIAVKGNPVAGVIHQAFIGEEGRTYWGWQDHGFSPSVSSDIKRASIKAHSSPVEGFPVKAIVSRSHAGSAQLELEKMFDKVEVVSAAGAGYKVLQVLLGETDLYFHSTLIKKWDLCAGDAMLRTAKGNMTTRKGRVLSYGPGEYKNPDGVVATLANHDYYLKKAKL